MRGLRGDCYVPVMSSTDLAPLVFRGVIGAVFLAHGLNHVFGGGRLRGTAEWFAGLGVRPGYAHAVLASGVEVVAGVPLVFDRLIGISQPGWAGLLIGLTGAVGAALVLALCWRPNASR